MKVTEYVMKDNYQVFRGIGTEPLELPIGMFVKPIDERWVPEHVRHAHRYDIKNGQTYVYCRHGIFLIPSDKIRILE